MTRLPLVGAALAVAVVLTADAAGQRPRLPDPESPKAHLRPQPSGGAENPSPKQMRRSLRAAPRGLERHVNATITTKPSRISPGGRGQLVVILALQYHAVLRVGDTLKVQYKREQGHLKLGKWDIDPPPLGHLEKKFKNVPVWENTTQITLPLRIDGEAKYGQHNVGVVLTAQVTDGRSGEDLGTFSMPINGPIVIGEPVPKPGILRPPEPEPVPEVSDDQPTATAEPVRDVVAPRSDVVGNLVPIDRGPEPQPGPESDVGVLEMAPEDDTPWLLIAAPALVLLLLVGLALKRK